MAHRLTPRAFVAWLVLATLPGMAQVGKQRIAFQRELHNAGPMVTVMFTDGKAEDLATHASAPTPHVTPALAPNGRSIAFAAKVGEHYKLFTWALDESNVAVGAPVQVTPNDDTADKFPAWSPDSKRLAYLAIDGTGTTTLRVIGTDGTGMMVLTPVGYHATPSWRPDGKELLFIDLENKKPVLKKISVENGAAALPIQAESRITAASYSPTGSEVAAIKQNAAGLADLWIVKPYGIGGKKIVENISGCKSVVWLDEKTIMFNAAKVGDQSNAAFWTVTPAGGTPTGIRGIGAADQISYFSVQQSDLTPKLPTALGANTPQGPDGQSSAPKQRVPTGPVTILDPSPDTAVHGQVKIRIHAIPQVSTVVLQIGRQFMYAASPVKVDGSAPQVTFTWDTQEFVNFDPTRNAKFPDRYEQLLRFPDGDYTLNIQALDKDNNLIGKDSIKVAVQNSLPDSVLPTNLVLRYQFKDNQPDDLYNIHGEGTMFGGAPGLAPELAASLDAQVRRILIETRPGGTDVRTYVRQKGKEKYLLSFGTREATIPETLVSARYTISPTGDLSVVPQQREKIYLPLSQVVTPLYPTSVKVGTKWSYQMWVVADLLSREAYSVRANHVLDGVELLGDRKTVRIRSDYALSNTSGDVKLDVAPTLVPPGLRGASNTSTQPAAAATPLYGRGAAGTMPGTGAATTPGAASTPVPTLKIQSTQGVRYSWFDYETNKLLRVEDFVLYNFPAKNLMELPSYVPPAETNAATAATAAQAAAARRAGPTSYYNPTKFYSGRANTGIYDMNSLIAQAGEAQAEQLMAQYGSIGAIVDAVSSGQLTITYWEPVVSDPSIDPVTGEPIDNTQTDTGNQDTGTDTGTTQPTPEVKPKPVVNLRGPAWYLVRYSYTYQPSAE